MTAPVVVVVGSCNIDQVTYAERLPDDGETLMGRDYQVGFGGKGANQAVAAARFGGQVVMVAAVGEDDHGTATIANFATEGIATDHVVRVAGPSGVAPIWVDDAGRNRILVVPGANAHVPAALAQRVIVDHRPAVVVGQHEIPQAVTAAAFRAARAAGATTILNPAPAAPIPTELLDVADWLVPNESEFALLSGSTLAGDDASVLATVRAYGIATRRSLVVTLGARGAAVAPSGGDGRIVPAPSVTAHDTTGAGDAFVGAFAVGLGRGWSAVDAARLGCAAAADSVTRAGTQRSFATREAAAAILAGIRTD